MTYAEPLLGPVQGVQISGETHVSRVELLGLAFANLDGASGMVLEVDPTGTVPVADLLGLVPKTVPLIGPAPKVDLTPLPGSQREARRRLAT